VVQPAAIEAAVVASEEEARRQDDDRLSGMHGLGTLYPMRYNDSR
jgi:hypothetical protein